VHKRHLIGGVAVLSLAVATSAPVASSRAEALGCGTTITTDVKLQKDLIDCPSNGLVIGADGVTVDLNGHRIDGDAAEYSECGRTEPCDLGIFVDGHDDVTIENGSVREFAVGVLVAQSRGTRVAGIASSRHQYFGFVVARASATEIRNSSGHDNPRPDGDGLGIFQSHDLTIVGNAFRHNGQLGIHVENSRKLLIARNLIARNHDMGVLLEGDRNRLRRNRCVRNGACMVVGPADGNVIARNHAFRDGAGIAVENGRGNVVVRNRVVRAGTAGIRLGLTSPPIGGDHNVVRANRVRASGRDNFMVSRSDHDSLLSGNWSVGSRGDGFDVRSTSATLVGNRATGSAKLDFRMAAG
jgi:parallel beta helix pectate lyase-like protein